MSFFRSRIFLALIGLLVIGGGSAVVAVLTTPQSLRAAIVGAGQANGAAAGGASAATATAAAGGATSASAATATTPPAPTATTPPAPPANPPSSGAQIIDVKGTVATVTVSAGTFTMTTSSGTLTVVVTGSTQFSGDAKSLSALRSGAPAEVHGVVQANGSLQATEVNADSGN